MNTQDPPDEVHYCVLHWCPDTAKEPCKRCEYMDHKRDEQKDNDAKPR